MKASEAVVRRLRELGAEVIYEMVGGMITHLLDAAAQEPGLRIVSMHHEQGAAFAADGFGRVAGRPAIAMATSGPGATNLLTGIGSCYFDSVPAIFITGQVNRSEMRGDRGVRQLGFQETDIVAMARPITKAAWLVSDPMDLISLIDRAWALAVSGRPGPVLIDIPMDVQRADIPFLSASAQVADGAQAEILVEEAWAILRASERPLILVGGGLRSAGCMPAFRELAMLTGIPVVHSLMAVDALEYANIARVGMIGSYGNRWANQALGEADALLVLGSRLDIRQTGADTASFCKGKRIVHVDCDPTEQNNRITGCVAINSGLSQFIAASQDLLRKMGSIQRPGWIASIAHLRATHPDDSEQPPNTGIHPNRLMHAISLASRACAGYVVDVGQHQMWAAQSLRLELGQFFLTSGGMGAMGYALPAAIGAAHAARGPVVMIAGDGGMQLNIQELQTVQRGAIPLKMIVVNNHCHGMVRQFQQSYFGSRYQSTVDGYSAPDFTAVSMAYGIPARRISASDQVSQALAWLWQKPLAPALVEVVIGMEINVYPKLAFGRPFPAMEPDAKPLDMEGT